MRARENKGFLQMVVAETDIIIFPEFMTVHTKFKMNGIAIQITQNPNRVRPHLAAPDAFANAL